MAYLNQNTNYKIVNSPESYLKETLNTEFSCSEIGSYSIDAQGNFYNNSQQELSSLIPDYQSKHGDLTAGFDPSLQINHSNLDRPLDAFLYWILLNKDNISKERHGSSPARRLDAEFVFSAGVMKKLLATVFNTGSHKQPWKMYAAKYNGTIYICKEEENIEAVGPSREPKLGCRNREEEMKKILHMGKKVEELISVSFVGQSQGMPADRKVDGRQGFYSVRRGTFGGRHLVLTRAEVDFVENGEYTECKLCLKYTGRDEWKFPMYKLRDWWYHMYAGDMKQVLYAIRDGPRLEQVSRVKRSDIPFQVKNPRMSCPPAIKSALRSWNPLASIGFVDDFFQWLKGVVVEDSYGVEGGHAVQYVLEWEKGSSSIGCSRDQVRMSNFVLLPDWYIKEMSAFFA